MRVVVAGATGVLGRPLVELLVQGGHEVAGTTRTSAGADALTASGALALVGDVYDERWIIESVAAFRPDAIVNHLTDLPDDASRLDDHGAANARIRRVGTAHLLAAADAAGARRFVAQSVAWSIPGDGGAAVDEMEQMVLDAQGVVLRYGQLYGQGTYHPDHVPEPPRIHVDDAAVQTVPALAMRRRVLTVVDAAGGARPR